MAKLKQGRARKSRLRARTWGGKTQPSHREGNARVSVKK